MPVNFDILKQIQPPQVSGTIAPSPPSVNPIDSLAGGMMQGFESMGRLQNEQQRTRQQQEMIQQNERQLKMQEEKHSWEMKDAPRKEWLSEKEFETIKAQYEQGKTLDDKALALVGPAKAAEIQSQRATTSKILQEVTKGNAEYQYATVDIIASANAIAGEAAANGATPEQVNKIYQSTLNIAPAEMQPIINKILKDSNSLQYSPDNNLMWSRLGEDAKMRFALSKTGQLPSQGSAGTELNDKKKERWHKDSIVELTNQIKIAKANNEDVTDLQKELESHKQGLLNNASETTSTKDANSSSKVIQELDIGDMKSSQTAAQTADSNIQDYETFLKLNKNFKTGMFAETGLNIAKAYTTLTGRDVASTKFGEALTTKGMDFIFQRIQDTKGAISDKEMEAFKRASAGMAQTPEGNELILKTAIAVEKRNKEKYDQQRDYYEENGSLKGFNAKWSEYLEKNPVLDTASFEKYTSGNSTSGNKSSSAPIIKELNGSRYEKRADGWYQVE